MEKKEDKFLVTLREFIKSVVISFILVIIITQFIARPVRVEGHSMEPNLSDKELGFSNILGIKVGNIKRFDVVVIHLKDQNKYIVKRVIGLPGDTVEVKNDQLFINDMLIEQPFLNTEFVSNYVATGNEFTTSFGPVTIPSGEYFALGDNRPRSSDSRKYGTFKEEQIVSKDVFVFSPISRMRKVGH